MKFYYVSTGVLCTGLMAVLTTIPVVSQADWWDGWTKENGYGNSWGDASGSGNSSAQGSGSGSGKTSGTATGKGDAGGEIDFAINFKGKARTDMDAKAATDGAAQSDAQFIGNAANSANSASTIMGRGAGRGDNNYAGWGGVAPEF
jgi:hypothetical protein